MKKRMAAIMYVPKVLFNEEFFKNKDYIVYFKGHKIIVKFFYENKVIIFY